MKLPAPIQNQNHHLPYIVNKKKRFKSLKNAFRKLRRIIGTSVGINDESYYRTLILK